MKSFRVFLWEALTMDQKKIVDKLDVPHHSFSDHVFGKDHKISIPLENNDAEPHPDVHEHLKQHGYEITNYTKGLARDKHNRETRIGKVLEKTKAPQHVKDSFVKDKNRESSQNRDLHVVISRHPHDVAAMSTGQGWSSCMNLNCGKEKISKELHHGTHVAYLAHKNDHDLSKPIARIALKPWNNHENTHTVLRPEDETYGHGGPAFDKTVKNWSEKNFPLHDETFYEKNKNVYDDSEQPAIFNKNEKTLNKLVNSKNTEVRSELAKHPEHAGKLVNDHEPFIRAQVAQHKEHAGKLVNDPSPYVRREVAQHPEHAGKLVNDPDRDVRLQVAKHKEHAGKLVNDPNYNVRAQVAKHPEHVGKLVNDHNFYVRLEVAKHPEYAGKLVNDSDHIIKKIAKQTLGMR